MTNFTYAPYPTPNTGPTPGPRPSPQAPPPSRTMAGWALGLSLFFGIFLIPLAVSVTLAIIVLSRPGDARAHGKGMALAALIIDGLALVGGVLVVAIVYVFGAQISGLDDTTRDNNGQVTESGDVTPSKLQIGDCVNDPAVTGLAGGEETDAAATVEAVPCAQPHDLEVFHRFNVPGDDFPGDESALAAAQNGCTRAFRDFVGRPFRTSRLEISYYLPTAEAWDRFDYQHVTCLVSDPDGPMRGSVADADRSV